MASYFPRSPRYATSLVEARCSESPAAKCAVINCKNSAIENDVKFYPFPEDPTERKIWVALLARVDRSRHPWQIQQSKLHYVCSKHFLGNRRFLLPETDHYFPSIFPAILNENCLPNVSPLEEKFALFPRAAGFYKHKLQEGTEKISIYRGSLPDLDKDGLKWSELQEIAYENIYLPFTTEFNKIISQIRSDGKKTASQVNEMKRRIKSSAVQMKLSLELMHEAEREHSAKAEVNIYNTAEQYPDQGQFAASARGWPSNKPQQKRKVHSYVSGLGDTRIPIDVTLPSIVKDWQYTELRWPRIGEKVFVLDKSGNWLVSVVTEYDASKSMVSVKPQGSTQESVVRLGHVAYGSPQETQIQLGCRVLAVSTSPQPGVVMEYPKWQNSNRYLILFENGRWAYHDHRSIFLLCLQTSHTWERVSPEIQEIIRNFFLSTEHPLVRVEVGQKLHVNREGLWLESEVKSLDGNLIEVAFPQQGSKVATEWLYAGSCKLQLINNLNQVNANSTRKYAKRKIVSKPNGPYVEYTDDAIDVITLSDDDEDQDAETQNQKKNTARKSNAQHIPRRKKQTSVVENDLGFAGSVVKAEIEPLAKSKDFVLHACQPSCLPINEDPLAHTAHSPYLMPYLMAWKRMLVKSNEAKSVIYKAPCGKCLRNEPETLTYLLQTKCKIKIDQFCFDPEFDMFAIWEPQYKNVFINDITNGEEPYPVSFLNGIDSNQSELVPYWPKRRPTKAAKRSMVLDEDFLPCCTCEDNCLDRANCQCQSLTVDVSDSISGEKDRTAGYTFRSLMQPQRTGIFECNARCSCKAQCINKVAQNGVQVRLQIFKTQKKGLGVRTVHDIPKGRFLCTYAGTILTDKEAEASGQDTYFAELDFIDIVTADKPGYESAVSDLEDDIYSPANSDNESSAGISKPDALRKLYFGKEENFVMDALEGGNIGRYFNHSCDPNIFVQNVFVDTHDLRFPWLGFFTERLIKAGEELTWDYSYEIGSVKGKKLLCYCNAANCRKRLL